ncbi:MAG: VWA domain-containing protein [Deltaproteobacteria bacterium]|nr:VWA domain-containing protein [Deltaproteobacteria bacterium]
MNSRHFSIFCATLFLLVGTQACKAKPPESAIVNEPIAKATQQKQATFYGAAATPSEPPAAALPEPPPSPQPAAPAPLEATPPAVEPAPPGMATLSEPSEPASAEGVKSLAAPSPPSDAVKKEGAEELPALPRLLSSKTNIIIAVDAPGSMSTPFIGTTKTKSEMLSSVIAETLERVADNKDYPRNVGIRVFGSESPASDNNCQDQRLIIPLGEVSPVAAQKLLGKITAKGSSPIFNTLAAALDDFPPLLEADRVIVLITDGRDSCEADPCARIKELKAGKPKTQIHVVGFDLAAEDTAFLECLATTTDGKFLLARNEEELRTSLDEAINSTVPYNVKIATLAGNVPIPTELTFFAAGTSTVARKESSFGTKLLQITPGTYDLMVEYVGSPEAKKPSKLIKGIEVLADSKIEHAISFDLGSLSLQALDEHGGLAEARYQFIPEGTETPTAEIEGKAEVTNVFLSPGKYTVTTELHQATPEFFSLEEKGIDIGVGQSVEKTFRFQRGEISFDVKTSQGQAIPFLFQLMKAGQETIVASGALPAEGGNIAIAPGIYDIVCLGQDPTGPVSPRVKLAGLVVAPSETTTAAGIFEMGSLTITAEDTKKKALSVLFSIREQGKNDFLVRMPYDAKTPVKLSLPPGNYDILAEITEDENQPKPSIWVNDVIVAADKPTDSTAVFSLGQLRLRSRDAKEREISAFFTIYNSDTNDLVSKSSSSKEWKTFYLPPGHYDALAENGEAPAGQEAATVWVRDINVKEGEPVSHEAVFTAGKIKIIGRGPNNKIIKCSFRVFQYGADRELISGETGDDWKLFEIQPGKYYIEASYNDPDASQLLKKWINVSIDEGEQEELVLRF